MKEKGSVKEIFILLLALVWLCIVICLYLADKKSKVFSGNEVIYNTKSYTHKKTVSLVEKEQQLSLEYVPESIEEAIIIDTNTEEEREDFALSTNSSDKKNTSKKNIDSRERCGNFLCNSGSDFVDIYNRFEQKQDLIFSTKYIYKIWEVDEYLKKQAQKRGYQKRGFAKENNLVSFSEIRTRPEVRDAFIMMQNEMLQQGMKLSFVSGYRSSISQRKIFTKKMGLDSSHKIPSGIYDVKINKVLSVSALPGYSKHHSGYALDVGCGNDVLVYDFVNTNCYAWMSVNNFENTKKFGFIPSYPQEVDNQGPDPEPWEFVWVGVSYIE